MKTRDLIAALRECDPSGELECCVDNADIDSVGDVPAYYDGCLQVLRRDEDGEPTKGADYVGAGRKVVISPTSITRMICFDPEAPVGFRDVNEQTRARLEAFLEEHRDKARDLHRRVAAMREERQTR